MKNIVDVKTWFQLIDLKMPNRTDMRYLYQSFPSTVYLYFLLGYKVLLHWLNSYALLLFRRWKLNWETLKAEKCTGWAPIAPPPSWLRLWLMGGGGVVISWFTLFIHLFFLFYILNKFINSLGQIIIQGTNFRFRRYITGFCNFPASPTSSQNLYFLDNLRFFFVCLIILEVLFF